MKCCRRCKGTLEIQSTGRRRRYCSPACKHAAYRKRTKQSVHFSSATCEWATPVDFFEKMNIRFGGFNLDPCATAENAKCPNFFTQEQDGLRQTWTGRVWLNPPYGRTIGLWLEKAQQSVRAGDVELVVCLVPARVDTRWWNDYCADAEFEFLRGRLRFGGAKNSAPFPSALVVFRNASEGQNALRNDPETALCEREVFHEGAA